MIPVTLNGPVLVLAMAAPQVPDLLVIMSIFFPLFEPMWTRWVRRMEFHPSSLSLEMWKRENKRNFEIEAVR